VRRQTFSSHRLAWILQLPVDSDRGLVTQFAAEPFSSCRCSHAADLSRSLDLNPTVILSSTSLVVFLSNCPSQCMRMSASMALLPSALELLPDPVTTFLRSSTMPARFRRRTTIRHNFLFARHPVRVLTCFGCIRPGLQHRGLPQPMPPHSQRLIIRFADALHSAGPYPVADVIGTQQRVIARVRHDLRQHRWRVGNVRPIGARKSRLKCGRGNQLDCRLWSLEMFPCRASVI
jgi:hypothetical protein